MLFGFGIVAYRNIIKALIVAFAVLSVPALVQITIYSAGQGYDYNLESIKGNEIYSLGNLGYSKVQCENIPIGVGYITLLCEYGSIGSILDIGVNRKSIGFSLKSCSTTDVNAFCRPTNPKFLDTLTKQTGLKTVNIKYDMTDLWELQEK